MAQPPIYEDPTFEELLSLCQTFGMIREYEPSLQSIRITSISEVFETDVDEAELLMRGMLLGYFYGQSGEDLTEAKWEE